MRVKTIIKYGFLWAAAAVLSLYLILLWFIVWDLTLTNKSFCGLVIAGIVWLVSAWKLGNGRIGRAVKVLAVISVCISLLFWGGLLVFYGNSVYENVDTGKTDLYAGKSVMLIIPHQDDDLNLMGGILEEYVKYGSEVRVVFSTNGDFTGMAETRYKEARKVLGDIGIPADHIIFLGYGDQYAYGGPHLYNGKPGEVITSVAGRTQTYGMEFHPAYREGRDYTAENYHQDLRDVILEYSPEILICSDYDPHIDHKALSLAFDKVMGTILKENPDYRPTVYKAFAYGSAWLAEMDYYQDNMASTAQFPVERMTYRWENRVRFPVNGGTLSRSLLSAPGYHSLKGYYSQGAYIYGEKIINGDRVFWSRDTESVCLGAEILVTSGDGHLLNDFMRLENRNLVDETRAANDGVWMPTTDDREKMATILLQQPTDLYSIVLYDHPSKKQNTTEAEILFDDGTSVSGIVLEPMGTATEVVVEKAAVTSFSVRILSAEGDESGLTEIEAFAHPRKPEAKFLKLMDSQEHFVYDYWVGRDGVAEFTVYTQGMNDQAGLKAPDIEISNSRCTAVWENDRIRVSCPKGEKTVLTVSVEEGTIADSVVIRNPGEMMRGAVQLCQRAEKRIIGLYYGIRYGLWDQEPSAAWVMEKTHMLKYYIVKYLF